MLRPTKHSHPDRTIINVSLLILVRLRERRIEEYDTLQKYIKRSVIGGDVLFLPALNLLFLMGVIDYKSKSDAVEYLGTNEII